MEMAIAGLRVGRLLVFLWLHSKDDPPDGEWDAAFDMMKARQRREGVAFPDMRAFIISDGGAPNGLARARIGRDFPMKSSVITNALDNPVKRGIATALMWVNPRFFFGTPKDALRAAEHIDVADHWDVLLPAFLEMQKALPPIDSLAIVADLLRRKAAS